MSLSADNNGPSELLRDKMCRRVFSLERIRPLYIWEQMTPIDAIGSETGT